MKEVEQYSGVGKPPRFDLILKAAMPDGSTPPDLTLPVTLTGVKQPTTITLEREAQQCRAQKESLSSELEIGIISCAAWATLPNENVVLCWFCRHK